MKYPISLVLALPVLFTISAFIEGDRKSVLVTVGVLGLMFLLETKIKYGSISKDNLNKFFNTPIKAGNVLGIEPAIDTSPKVSLLSGILIILGGGSFIVLLIFLYFAFFS